MFQTPRNRVATLAALVLLATLLTPSHAQANECTSHGLSGSCSACICCCYSSGAGFVTYEPSDNCTCDRKVDTSRVASTIVISIMVLFVALLSSLYFSGVLCALTPFPRNSSLVSVMRPPLTANHTPGYAY